MSAARRRAKLLILHGHLMDLSRAIRTGRAVAVDGAHPQRDVDLVLAYAALVRRQYAELLPAPTKETTP